MNWKKTNLIGKMYYCCLNQNDRRFPLKIFIGSKK